MMERVGAMKKMDKSCSSGSRLYDLTNRVQPDGKTRGKSRL